MPRIKTTAFRHIDTGRQFRDKSGRIYTKIGPAKAQGQFAEHDMNPWEELEILPKLEKQDAVQRPANQREILLSR